MLIQLRKKQHRVHGIQRGRKHGLLGLPCAQLLSRVWLFAAPWTVAGQAPLSMGILQARILEWLAMLFSRGSSQPRDRTQISHIASGFSPSEPPGKLTSLIAYWGAVVKVRGIKTDRHSDPQETKLFLWYLFGSFSSRHYTRCSR